MGGRTPRVAARSVSIFHNWPVGKFELDFRRLRVTIITAYHISGVPDRDGPGSASTPVGETVVMPEFQPGERVRVREEGGDPSYPPEKSLLGKEGTIQYGTGEPGGRDRHFLYVVKFDSEELRSISGDWLEPAVILRKVKEESIE